MDGFSETHVIGEDAAELIGRKVGEEVKSFDLVGTKIHVESWRDLRTDLQLEIFRPVRDPFPGFGVEDFPCGGFGELEGVEAVHFSSEIERIESDARDGFGLLVAEIHFQAQPATAIHPDKLSPGLDECADLLLGEVETIHFDDHFEIEPVDLFVHHLEGDLRLDRIGFESGKVLVGPDFDLLRAATRAIRRISQGNSWSRGRGSSPRLPSKVGCIGAINRPTRRWRLLS